MPLRTCVIQCTLLILLAHSFDTAHAAARAKVGCAKRCPEPCRPENRHLISTCKAGATETDPWTMVDLTCDAAEAATAACPLLVPAAAKDEKPTCVCMSPAEIEAKKKADEEAVAAKAAVASETAQESNDGANPVIIKPVDPATTPTATGTTEVGCADGALACKSLTLHGGKVEISHREVTSITVDVLDADGNPGGECSGIECLWRVCATTLGDGVNMAGQSLFVGFGALPQCMSRGTYALPCSNINSYADSCEAQLDALVVDQDVNGWVVTKIEDAYFPTEDDKKDKDDDADAVSEKAADQPKASGKRAARAAPAGKKLLELPNKRSAARPHAKTSAGAAAATAGKAKTVSSIGKFTSKHKPVKPVTSMEVCRTFFMNDILNTCPGTTVSPDHPGVYDISVVAETRVASTECDKRTCPGMEDGSSCCTEAIHAASRKIHVQIDPVGSGASVEERVEKITTFNMETYMLYAQSIGDDMCYKFATVTDKPTVLSSPSVKADSDVYPYHISFAGACPESMRGSEWDPALQHCSMWRVCSEADKYGVHVVIGEAGTEYCSKLAISFNVGTGDAVTFEDEEQSMVAIAYLPSCFNFAELDENGNPVPDAAAKAAEAINKDDVVIDVRPVVIIRSFVGVNCDIPYNSAHPVPDGSFICFEGCIADYPERWPGMNLVLDIERVEVESNGSSVIIFPDDPIAAKDAAAIEAALAAAKDAGKSHLTDKEIQALKTPRKAITKDDDLYAWRGYERLPARAGADTSTEACVRWRQMSNATDANWRAKMNYVITADIAESIEAGAKRRRLLGEYVSSSDTYSQLQKDQIAVANARIARAIKRGSGARTLLGGDDDDDDDNHGCKWGAFCGAQVGSSFHHASSACGWGYTTTVLHCQSTGGGHHHGHGGGEDGDGQGGGDDDDDEDEEDNDNNGHHGGHHHSSTQTLICLDGRPALTRCVRSRVRNSAGVWALFAALIFITLMCCVGYCVLFYDDNAKRAVVGIHGWRTSTGGTTTKVVGAADDGGRVNINVEHSDSGDSN